MCAIISGGAVGRRGTAEVRRRYQLCPELAYSSAPVRRPVS